MYFMQSKQLAENYSFFKGSSEDLMEIDSASYQFILVVRQICNTNHTFIMTKSYTFLCILKEELQ